MLECMLEVRRNYGRLAYGNFIRFSCFFWKKIIETRTVIILSVRGTLIRKFMLVAHSLGMTKGEYVFLDVEIFQVSL